LFIYLPDHAAGKRVSINDFEMVAVITVAYEDWELEM
jgi:hypothetical protein